MKKEYQESIVLLSTLESKIKKGDKSALKDIDKIAINIENGYRLQDNFLEPLAYSLFEETLNTGDREVSDILKQLVTKLCLPHADIFCGRLDVSLMNNSDILEKEKIDILNSIIEKDIEASDTDGFGLYDLYNGMSMLAIKLHDDSLLERILKKLNEL